MKMNKKGFTLAELLVVVAIIAVLVAISIPVFTSQLEKSREAVDLANLRAAYAECATEAITAGADITKVAKVVNPVQKTSGWEAALPDQLGTVAKANIPSIVTGTPVYVVVNADGTAEITATAPTGTGVKTL